MANKEVITQINKTSAAIKGLTRAMEHYEDNEKVTNDVIDRIHQLADELQELKELLAGGTNK